MKRAPEVFPGKREVMKRLGPHFYKNRQEYEAGIMKQQAYSNCLLSNWVDNLRPVIRTDVEKNGKRCEKYLL